MDATELVEGVGISDCSDEEVVGTNWDTARANSSARWSAKFAVLNTVDGDGSCEEREVREKKLDTCDATSAAKFSMLAEVISPMGVA